MKKVLITLAVVGFAAAPAYAGQSFTKTGLNTANPVFAQKDCKEGEKWNEEKKMCEAKNG